MSLRRATFCVLVSAPLVACVVSSGTRGAGADGSGGGTATSTVETGTTGTDTAGSGTSKPSTETTAPTETVTTATSTVATGENWAIEGEPAGTPTTIAGLGAQAWDLGDGRVRLHWDFSTSEQAADWEPLWDTLLSLDASGALRVARNPGVGNGNQPWCAGFKRGILIDRVSYRMNLMEGSHVNIFVSSLFQGVPAWAAATTYDLGVNGTETAADINGARYANLSSQTVVAGSTVTGVVKVSNSGIDWTLGTEQLRISAAITRDTSRSVAFGGFASTVIVDDVTLVGKLAD